MKRATRKNLPLVWLRLTAYVNECLESGGEGDFLMDDVNAFLDRLSEQDAFGTEGQCDPRGDQRG